MPKYSVAIEGGGTYEVNSPTELTNEQAWAAVQNQIQNPPPPAQSAGFSPKNLGLAALQGLSGGAQSITDLFGAGNAASKQLDEFQKQAEEAKTPERKAEIARRNQIIKEAEKSGSTWEEIKAQLGGFAEAPLEVGIQALASSVPIIAGSFLAPEAAVPAAGVRLSAAARAALAARKAATSTEVIGGAMGLGSQKGQDYEEVKRALMENGVPEPEAEKKAQEAAEYSLQNLPRQAFSAATGALEGKFGIEKPLGRLGKAAKPLEGAAAAGLKEPTWSQAILKNTIGEALPEGAQAFSGRIGTNVALNQAGIPTDIFEGVPAAVVHDMAVGAVLGAATSPAKMSEMRKEFAATKMEEKDRLQKELDAFQAPEGTEKTQLLLPAPPKTVTPKKEDLMPNPLGNITRDELGPEVTAYIDQHRAANNLPHLQSYSIEDVKDAMTGVNPEGEKAALNSILTAKTGFSGEETYSPQDVIAAAAEKNVATETKGFNDFLTRTTGESTLENMSQPQLYAAFKALKEMQRPATGIQLVLPEGSNASREQAPSPEPKINLPTGHVIQQTTLQDGEKPSGYAIIPKGEGKPLVTVATEEEATAKAEDLQKERQKETARVLNEILGYEAEVKASANNLTKMEADGKVGTEAYAKAQAQHALKQQVLGGQIEELYNRIETLTAPLDIKPTGMQPVTRTAHVLTKNGQTLGTYPTHVAAENAVLSQMTDEELGKVVSDKRFGGFSDRAANEQNRRKTEPKGKKVSEVHAGIEEEKQKPIREKQIAEIMEKLTPILQKFGLGNVGLKIATDLKNAEGEYTQKLIQIALDVTDHIGVLRHESIHALRELGFFSDQQWSVLENRAKSEWIDKYLKNRNVDGGPLEAGQQSRYDAYHKLYNGNEDSITEEAIADAFRDFDVNKAPPGMIAALLNKIKAFFNALNNAVRGAGFQTAEELFGKIERGELTATAEEFAANAEKLSLRTNPEVQKAVAGKVNLTPQESAATSLGLQTGKSKQNQFANKKIGGLSEVVQFLQDRRIASGLKPLDINNKEDRTILAKLLSAEAVAAIHAGGNALAWYNETIARMMGMAALKFPELATNRNAQMAFKLSTAITSQGLNVEDNLAFSMKQYESYAYNKRVHGIGQFDEIGQGADEPAMISNFKLANRMLKEYGEDATRKFLETEFLAEELRSAGFKITGELGDEKITGSSIFGPKIGFGFYSNLNGNFEPVTMDMWFMRLVGRLTGSLRKFDPELFKTQLSRFRKAFDEEGDNGIYANDFSKEALEKAKTDEASAIEFARVVNSVFNIDFKNHRELYNEKAFKKTELVYSAQQILGAVDSPRDAPSNGTERRQLRDVVNQTVDMVSKIEGQRIPPAALQALIWYPEQELYSTLGVKLRVTSQDYAGAIKKILLKEGHSEQSISAASKSGARQLQRMANQPVGQTVGQLGQKPQTAFTEEERSDFLEQARTKTVIEQERKEPKRKKIVFEVAPDPNNKALAESWRSLDQDTRLKISESIAKKVVRKVLAEFDLNGSFTSQVGSYQEDTNPSFALFLENGDAVEVSKFLGYVLAQDSMMIISPKEIKGTEKVGAITIDIKTQDPKKIDDIYQQLRSIHVNGKQPIGGQSTMNGKMIVLNYSDFATEDLARLIDHQLNGDYNVLTGDVYAAFPEKESYNYASPSDDPRGKGADLRQRSRVLRNEATQQLRDELFKIRQQEELATGKRENIATSPAAKAAGNLKNVITDKTLFEAQTELNQYNENLVNERVTDVQRSRAEKALTPYMELAKKEKPAFDAVVERIAKDVGVQARLDPIKNIVRSAEKLVLETENGTKKPDASLILDLLRATIVVDTEAEIPNAIKQIQKSFDVIRVKDRFKNPDLTGYRDVLVNVKLPSGLVAEIQVNIPAMIGSKSTGHKLYRMSRNMEQGTSSRMYLEDLSRRLYEEAYRFSQNAISSASARDALLRNTSEGKARSGSAAKTIEPSLSSRTGVASTAQTLAPSGTSNIQAPTQNVSITKASLRTAPNTPAFKQFFGNSKIVDENGKPKVMYHGTARDITEFRPHQAGAIFVTDNPETAERYTQQSAQWMSDHATDMLSPKQMREATATTKNLLRENGYTAKQIAALVNDKGLYKTDEFREAVSKYFGSAANILPLYVRAENPFDYENPAHVKALMERVPGLNKAGFNRVNNWTSIEGPKVQEAIKAMGFDSFYVAEHGDKNLAVYEPTQIKSSIGNEGTYSRTNPDVRKSLRRNLQDEVESLPGGTDILNRVYGTTTAREEKGWIGRMMDAISPKSLESFRAAALNRYNQLGVYEREIAKKMGGVERLADLNAESAALMSDLAAGVTASVLGVHDKHGGVPVYKNGYTTVDSSIEGPIQIFAPLAAMGDPFVYRLYQFYAASHRGVRLNDEGREEKFTLKELAYAKALGQKYKEFEQVRQKWLKFNNALVDYQVATGILSKEKAAEFIKYSDYVPFFRQLDGESTIGPNIFQSLTGVKGPKKLKGSEAPLADFLETIVRNTQAAVQAGMKNTAGQKAVDAAVFLGTAEKLDHVSSSPDVVTVLRDGKPVSYLCADQEFIHAVKSLNLPEMPFLSILAAPSNLLRNMVTKDPGFILANMMRDSLSAYVVSGIKGNPLTHVASVAKNFGKTLVDQSPEYQQLLKAGVIGGYDFSKGIKASGKSLNEALVKQTGTESGAAKLFKPATSIWGFLEKATEASDAATRIEVFKKTLAETNNEAEAMFRALEVMNFNRKGSSAVIRIATAAIPFLNARIQGLDVFYRSGIRPVFAKDATAREKEVARTFIIRGLTIMALSAMYIAAISGDPDYEKQEQETKDNNWLIPSLGIRIPIPFEVGTLFKTIPERIYLLTTGHDTPKDFQQSMTRAITSTFMINPVPQIALPIVETITNYSFFTGRPIIGQNMQNIEPEFQSNAGTSKTAIVMGKELGVSPIKIDHIFQGYTGAMGVYASSLIDAIINSNSDNPSASKRFEQTPVLKRFLIDPEARGKVSAYYDLKDQVDTVVRTINMLKNNHDPALEAYWGKNEKLYMARHYMSNLDQRIQHLNRQAAQIRSSEMPANEKRDALLEITKATNEFLADIQTVKKELTN